MEITPNRPICFGLIIMELLEKYARFNVATNNNEGPPLHLAVKKSNKDAVCLLLENGADVNKKNLAGNCPLHLATCVNVAKMLINKGANIEEKNVIGTPLFHAAGRGCKDVVEFLLKKGAYIDSKNFNDFTPLSIAVLHGKKDVVDLLLQKGANINVEVGSGPLHLVNCDDDCGKSLIKYALLLNREPKKEEVGLLKTRLSSFWDNCKDQLLKMLGESSVPLYRFLQETNEDKLVNYLSNESTGLRQKQKNMQNFNMYADLVTRQIKKAKHRENLLNNIKLIMEQCGLKILPLEIKNEIAKYLTSADLEITANAFANELKRKSNNSEKQPLQTVIKKRKC